MEKNYYEELQRRLDTEELELLNAHPVPNPTGLPHSVGLLIRPNMDVSQVPKDKLSLLHTMLHMFYHNRSGKGLTQEDIINIHGEVTQKLVSHEKYDGLDNNELH